MARGKKYVPKLGSPLTPDSPGDPTVIVPPMAEQPGGGEDGWSFNMASLGLTIDLSADILVDAMTRACLTHTREAILAGVRPDGGGSQRKLGLKAASLPGRQSPFRGFNTGQLADGIKRTRIKGSKAKASSRIVGPSNRNVYLAQEAAKGVNFLTAEGKSGEAMREAAQAAVEAMVSGREVLRDTGDVEADDV